MTTPAAPEPVVTAPESVTPEPTPSPVVPEPPNAEPPPNETPEQYVKRLEAEVKKANTAARDAENKARVNAKENARTEARAELAQEFGKILGLVENEAADPTKLAELLTAQTAQTKQVALELAAYKAAAAAGADATALLDSRAFMAKLAEVDPSDSVAVTAAIAEAVKANPAFVPSRVPAPNPALGASASGAPYLEAQIADAQKRGDYKAVIHLQNQKLFQS